jgi:hypothetical protein
LGKFKYEQRFKTAFVTDEQKQALIASNNPFEITKIRFSPKGTYGPQFYLSCRFIDGTEGTMTFSAESNVFTRDDLLDQLKTYLTENPGESVVARLREEGNTRLIDVEE